MTRSLAKSQFIRGERQASYNGVSYLKTNAYPSPTKENRHFTNIQMT